MPNAPSGCSSPSTSSLSEASRSPGAKHVPATNSAVPLPTASSAGSGDSRCTVNRFSVAKGEPAYRGVSGGRLRPMPSPGRDDFWRALRSRHPRFHQAVVDDARVTALHRGERHEFRSRFDAARQIGRLAWTSDAFLAQALYRAKARMQALGVLVLPRIAHRLAMMLAQVSIGDP